jgi:hypothetical protein
MLSMVLDEDVGVVIANSVSYDLPVKSFFINRLLTAL